MNFLPPTYEMPANGESNYLKFEDGQNRFRVLSEAVTGYLYWTDEHGKSVLSEPVKGCKTMHVKNAADIPEDHRKSGNCKPKHFWAFVVYNYRSKSVQIAKLTQSSIMNNVLQYAQSPQWGSPEAYDIVVHKSGDGLATEYQVTVSPKEALDTKIQKQYQAMQIDLEALFKAEDPFKKSEGQATAQK